MIVLIDSYSLLFKTGNIVISKTVCIYKVQHCFGISRKFLNKFS